MWFFAGFLCNDNVITVRWMSGKTRKNRIRNAYIRDMVEVTLIDNKLKENRLRWYGHVCRRPIDMVVRRSDMIIGSDDTRERGRPKLTLDAVVKRIRLDGILVNIWPSTELNGVKEFM